MARATDLHVGYFTDYFFDEIILDHRGPMPAGTLGSIGQKFPSRP
jgi:hypothetical protein